MKITLLMKSMLIIHDSVCVHGRESSATEGEREKDDKKKSRMIKKDDEQEKERGGVGTRSVKF